MEKYGLFIITIIIIIWIFDCREMAEDGKELVFDHGAPYFTAGSSEVMGAVSSWEERGFVTEWKEKFGAFDRSTARFIDIEKVIMCKSITSNLPL